MRIIYFAFGLLLCFSGISQENTNQNKFRQLYNDLPTPNSIRNASGAPGSEYWQTRADYNIDLTIDDQNQRLYGEETITYHNNSPDPLDYLWLQLDQNVRAKDSDSHLIRTNSIDENSSVRALNRMLTDFDGGFKLDYVKDANGKALEHMVNKTMLRVDPDQTIQPGASYTFQIKWWYNINNTRVDRGRSGYEPFAEDGNNVYVIAQWFPRMCSYNDVEGWQNKQFLGRGEFALIFGDYDVKITVPADHLVASSGELQNPKDVLTKEQQKRWNKAQKEMEQPVTIATKEEADERMKSKSTKTKTWHYVAKNVRDFAFATSRRFIWDAMGVKMSDGRTVMAASMWTKEGDCLWSRYSTKAVAHTIKWFSHYTFDYPYPIAWSIDGNMGMEYPMICFNYGRCQDDDTYSQRTKYGHIGVIIHEVGHNWFPMIVNSDERQWTWMDEGLNTFVQYLTEVQWERNYPVRRGPAHKITDYMGGDKSKISPIMTNSESIWQFGANAYAKPATALNILRESVMGRELFDYAFKEYANRWKFKSPSPADFFRTMEDASGVDLDWFWRGWFFTNDHADQAITSMNHYQMSNQDPVANKAKARAARDKGPQSISDIRNRKEIKQTYNEKDPSINDFYTDYDPLASDAIDVQEYAEFQKTLSSAEKKLLESGKHFYEMTFESPGGLVMPVIFEYEYVDGTTEVFRIPAEIWRFNDKKITKTFVTDKEVKQVTLDPFLEIADVDRSNNHYPPKPDEPSRFELFKEKQVRENPMQRANRAKKIIKP